MVKLLLDFGKLTQDEFKIRLEYQFKLMNGNPTYAMFNVLIAMLGKLSDDFTAALFEVKSGGPVEPKNQLRADANLFLAKFANKIEGVANDLATKEDAIAFAKGTGFNVVENTAKVRLTFLEAPTGLTINDDKPRKGACSLTWDRVARALTYSIQMLDKDGNWQDIGVSTLPKFLHQGTDWEVKRTYRIKAIGAGNLMSDYSEAVSVWVR
jgi:hypothetical protein